MIQLFNGCYCSDLHIFPKNWNISGASLKKDWYIYYRFYDPLYTDKTGKVKHKLCLVKGMNKFKTLSERRESTRILLDEELYALKQKGFNPFSKSFMNPTADQDNEFDIDKYTPFIEALYQAHKILSCSDGVKNNINSMLNFVGASAKRLRYDQVPISEIEKKHIRKIFSDLKSNKEKFSANQQNMYRAWLKMLFNEIDVIKYNPISDLKKVSEVKKIMPVLDDEKLRKQIDARLHEKCYTFWRFTQIFFHSGGREKELLLLKKKDVDLVNQKYRCVVYKGNKPRETERTIKNSVLDLWSELLSKATDNDYLFSKGLEPGPIPINYKQISRRWNRWIKKHFNIDIGFYKLKHLNTTQTIDILQRDIGLSESVKLAASQNGHTTEAMVVKIYDVKQGERKHEQLKNVNNKFA